MITIQFLEYPLLFRGEAEFIPTQESFTSPGFTYIILHNRDSVTKVRGLIGSDKPWQVLEIRGSLEDFC